MQNVKLYKLYNYLNGMVMQILQYYKLFKFGLSELGVAATGSDIARCTALI